MPTDQRHLSTAAAAAILTVGSGSLVGGAVAGQAWLAGVGAIIMIGATIILALSLRTPPRESHSPAPPPPLVLEAAVVRPAPAAPLFERVSDPVLLVDREGKVLHASASTSRVLGYAPGDLSGRQLGRLVHEDDATSVAGFLHDVIGNDEPGPSQAWRVRRADGGWEKVLPTATSLLDEPGIGGIAIVLRDDRREASLVDFPDDPPLRDPLTGLANRALFRDRVAHALERANRKQVPLAAVILEFDDFRASGNRATFAELEVLLSGAARRVQTCLRASDSAARLEGTRFGILLEDMAEEREVAIVTERLARLFTSPLSAHGREFIAGGNIGIATATPEDSAESLLRNADVALRAARRHGSGAVELFDANEHPPALGHRGLAGELQTALASGQLELLFQPIVILRTRRIAGLEALVRWRHPDRGTIPAAAFIPVAEESGLIVPLGRWVLGEACRQLARWKADIGAERNVTVTVNVTPRQLLDPDFGSDVQAAIGETGINPANLVFEVSERAFARSHDELLARIRELRKLGVRFAIEDFGSRSAVLGDPADIPVDIIKIDRAFIGRLTQRSDDHATTRAIVALGRLRRLRTVAPGVEHEEQLGELLRFRCEYGQGSLFSEPLRAEDVPGLLRRD